MSQPAIKKPCFDGMKVLFSIGVACLLLLLGCQPKDQLPAEVQKKLAGESNTASDEGVRVESNPSPVIAEGKSEPTVRPVVEQLDVDERVWIKNEQLPWSYSEAHYVGNTRIGFASITVTGSEVAEGKQIMVRREDVVDRNPDGSIAPIRKVILETFERPNGSVTGFRMEATVDGEKNQIIEGRLVGGQFDISRRENDQPPTRQSIPWRREFWGPHGVQQLLQKSPMKPGEIRTTSIFIPQLAQYVPVLLEARESELTQVADGKSVPLLLINLTIRTPESPLRSTLYVDDNGLIQKTLTLSGKLLLKLKIADSVLQRLRDQSQFAREFERTVAITGNASGLAAAPKAVLRLESREIDPYDTVLAYPRQKLRSVSPAACDLSIDPLRSTELLEDQKPAADHSAPTLLVPSDKEVIHDLAIELLTGKSPESDAEKAELLRNGLSGVIRNRPIEIDFTSPLIVARERVASCFETAHLLAALLRNQKIASRVVAGMRCDANSSNMLFHVWTQAFVGGKWVDLDGSSTNSVNAGYIVMAASTGATENPFTFVLPVLESIKKLRSVEVISIE